MSTRDTAWPAGTSCWVDCTGGVGCLAEGATPGWSTCFAVASADEAASYVERAGGQVRTPPVDMPYGRFAVMSGPWGAGLSVMQMFDA